VRVRVLPVRRVSRVRDMRAGCQNYGGTWHAPAFGGAGALRGDRGSRRGGVCVCVCLCVCACPCLRAAVVLSPCRAGLLLNHAAVRSQVSFQKYHIARMVLNFKARARTPRDGCGVRGVTFAPSHRLTTRASSGSCTAPRCALTVRAPCRCRGPASVLSAWWSCSTDAGEAIGSGGEGTDAAGGCCVLGFLARHVMCVMPVCAAAVAAAAAAAGIPAAMRLLPKHAHLVNPPSKRGPLNLDKTVRARRVLCPRDDVRSHLCVQAWACVVSPCRVAGACPGWRAPVAGANAGVQATRGWRRWCVCA
jgi:hypothetical protein